MRKLLSLTLIISMFFYCNVTVLAGTVDTYHGIDVSQYQEEIDYTEVKAAGIEVVYIKACQGSDFIDPMFEINYTNAKAAGLKIGFYHYITATNAEEAIAQADYLFSLINRRNMIVNQQWTLKILQD